MSFAQMFILSLIGSWSWLIKKEKPHMFIWRLISKTNPEKKMLILPAWNISITVLQMRCWHAWDGLGKFLWYLW